MSTYYNIKRKLFPNGTPDFTPQFRLEGRARTTGSESDSLAMKTADPLWMLGRQWQFGEFQAEDNGSPIQVRAFYNKEETSHYSFGDNGPRHPLNSSPLEAKVEAMPVSELDLKSKVRVGQRFEALVRRFLSQQNPESLIASIRGIYPLEVGVNIDSSTMSFFKLMEGKVVDGEKLIANIKNNSTPWSAGHLGTKKKWPTEITTLLREKVAARLEIWYDQFYVTPAAEQAWDQRKLAHQFKVHNAADDIHLHAPDYQAGHLDWYSFDNAEVRESAADHTTDTGELIPLNVSFPTLPAKRLFAFEDSRIDLTQMSIEPGELMKVMLLDFALISGSDWFTVPMKMELGEMCWVEKIEVTDVFGVTTTIRNDGQTGAILDPDGLKVWDMFKIRNENATEYKPEEHFLFLAPAATRRLESEPLEELLFLRDEYSNMVWGIERRLTNAMGNSVDGYNLHTAVYGSHLESEQESGNDLPQYRLASAVPSNWIPFLPQHLQGNNDETELIRAVMMRHEDSEDVAVTTPLSWLANNDLKNIREEAIPKAGVRVQVTNQRVRWTDGKTYLWRGRKVLTGRGEGNSGLQFDYLEEARE